MFRFHLGGNRYTFILENQRKEKAHLPGRFLGSPDQQDTVGRPLATSLGSGLAGKLGLLVPVQSGESYVLDQELLYLSVKMKFVGQHGHHPDTVGSPPKLVTSRMVGVGCFSSAPNVRAIPGTSA